MKHISRVEFHLRCISKIFFEYLTKSLRDEQLYPVSQLAYTKTFNWMRTPCEVPELKVYCEIECIVE